MSIGSLLLGAALLILVGLFLARPFLLSSARYGRQRTLRQELLAQKEAVLAQIQVLEFDFETGDMPEEDYQRQRRQLVVEAAEILKNLDELSSAAPSGKVDREIEAAVARRRQRQPQPAPAPVKARKKKAATRPQTAEPETAAAEATAPANGRVKFCSQCGKPVEEGDNFCAYCGNKIHQQQPT